MKSFFARGKYPEKGQQVQIGELKSTLGWLIHPDNMKHRRPNCQGKVLDFVPGHGGDIWFVDHFGAVAAYSVDEMYPLEEKGE